jgi:site-specific recombinase XerD
MTNNEFFEIYKKHQMCHISNDSFHTRLKYLRRHFIPVYGAYDIRDISWKHINSIYQIMEEQQYANNTIYGVYSALLSYFKLAIKKGELEYNPVHFAKSVRPSFERERRN